MCVTVCDVQVNILYTLQGHAIKSKNILNKLLIRLSLHTLFFTVLKSVIYKIEINILQQKSNSLRTNNKNIFLVMKLM